MSFPRGCDVATAPRCWLLLPGESAFDEAAPARPPADGCPRSSSQGILSASSRIGELRHRLPPGRRASPDRKPTSDACFLRTEFPPPGAQAWYLFALVPTPWAKSAFWAKNVPSIGEGELGMKNNVLKRDDQGHR